MRTSARTQREFVERQAAVYAQNFDLEALGYPVVSFRDGVWYIVDGQHRVAALRMMGWDDQQIECEVYEGLSEADEAELFLKRNNRRAVRPFDKFKVAVAAGREAESDINRIVMTLGLKVSEQPDDGCIQAVTALLRIYGSYGAPTLSRTLRIARDSYAKDRDALRGDVLMGLGLVVGKYNGQLDEQTTIAHLAKVSGGPLGLVGKARALRHSMGEALPRCIAAVIVDVVNTGTPSRRRLQPWWSIQKEETTDAV
jgi:uncharacterized protein DUF6551